MTNDLMDRPYTVDQVFALERDVELIADLLMFSRSEGNRWWLLVDGDPDTLASLLYDALIALQNEMTEEDD